MAEGKVPDAQPGKTKKTTPAAGVKFRILKLSWIVVLVISSFVLGYTLRPTGGGRSMPSFGAMASGNRTMGQAPPLNIFRR